MKLKLFSSVAIFLAFTSSAFAATFTVNSTTDAVDVTPGNGICATATATCTLRAAVQESNAFAGADTINIPAGTFSISISGASENLGATGDFDITESVNIKGAGVGSTIINGAFIDRIFDIVNVTAIVSVSDLTITSGSSGAAEGGGLRSLSSSLLTITNTKITHNSSTSSGGGGLFHSGPLTLVDSEIVSNQGNTGGGAYIVGAGPISVSGSNISFNRSTSAIGGMFLVSTSGNSSISNSTFSNNTSLTSQVGGLYVVTAGNLVISGVNVTDNVGYTQVGGLFLQTTAVGNMTLTNLKINNNSSPTGSVGGMIAITTNGNVNITNSELKDNFANSSISGAQVVASSAGNIITVDGLTATGNYTPSSVGALFLTGIGGVHVSNANISDNIAEAGLSAAYLSAASGEISVSKSSFNNNTSSGPAPGLFSTLAGTANFTADECNFNNNNTSNAAAALYVANGGTGTSTVKRSLFSGNQALVAPSVLFLSPGTIENNTFSANLSNSGGAVEIIGGAVSVKNNTFADNLSSTLGMPASLAVAAGATTLTGNIFDSNSLATQCVVLGGTLTSGGNNISDDSSCNPNAGLGDLVNTDSQLQALANNGGATLTRAIYSGSPAIDKFTGASCPATDQRGAIRPVDGDGNGTSLCDVGAYENADLCPSDPNKLLPSTCGCGVADVDTNSNTVIDCLAGTDLKRQASDLQLLVGQLRAASTKKGAKKQSAKITTIRTALAALVNFGNSNAGSIAVTGSKTLTTLLNNANSKVTKATKVLSKNYKKVKKAGINSLKDIGTSVTG